MACRALWSATASGDEHSIAFDEEAYSLGFRRAGEYDTEMVRFSYSSMTTPSQTYDYNMRTVTDTLEDARSAERPRQQTT